MITEDCVSFETAKLLKEEGFDEPCHCFYEYKKRLYNDMDKYFPNGMKNSDHDKEGNKGISAPTISLAMKWLRIERNIHIEPHIVKTKCSYGYMPNYVDLKELKSHFPFDEVDFSNVDKYVCVTYDKACEVTIKYYLKKINLNNYGNRNIRSTS